jgi:antitoxin (DNA-binding transcriptional repressor) of toxin-antitoxin stability system
MEYITFTQLRTESNNLAKALRKGDEVKLIRRSVVVGRVIPYNNKKIKIINAKKLQAKIDELNLPKLTLKEIDRRYRIAMMKKHGQGLS